ncbi:MAG: TM2 domain-containing protein [Caulobacteraceae bacterium]
MTDAANSTDLILIEQRVANEGPNLIVAYLLWLFLGLFSGHRFYLGKSQSAILQIISYIFVVGVFWWLMDLLLIPGLVAEKRQALRAALMAKLPKQEVPAASHTPATAADEIGRLWALKEAGALTEAEFDAQKVRLLTHD